MSEHYRFVRPLTATDPPHWPEGVAPKPFAAKDGPAVHRLMVRAYANGGGAVPDFESWWPAVAADSEFDPDLCVVAQARDGAVIGFALVWTSAFIKDVVVDPDWQGRGIGAAMLHEVFHRLASRGHQSVALKVLTGNTGAQRLYRRVGFAEG